jgi:hypothetical protein
MNQLSFCSPVCFVQSNCRSLFVKSIGYKHRMKTGKNRRILIQKLWYMNIFEFAKSFNNFVLYKSATQLPPSTIPILELLFVNTVQAWKAQGIGGSWAVSLYFRIMKKLQAAAEPRNGSLSAAAPPSWEQACPTGLASTCNENSVQMLNRRITTGCKNWSPCSNIDRHYMRFVIGKASGQDLSEIVFNKIWFRWELVFAFIVSLFFVNFQESEECSKRLHTGCLASPLLTMEVCWTA